MLAWLTFNAKKYNFLFLNSHAILEMGQSLASHMNMQNYAVDIITLTMQSFKKSPLNCIKEYTHTKLCFLGGRWDFFVKEEKVSVTCNKICYN